jgi:hypothetical protein
MVGDTNDNKKRMLEALGHTMSNVSKSAKMVGIARNTHYEWMKDDEQYKSAVEELENEVLDFAEDCLHNEMANGNVAAIIFKLKTKGKKRGYIERVETEISGPNGGPIQITGMTIE